MPLLRLHGANDSLVPVAQEADETEILRKGGVENFFLALNGQGHAWVISTVGGKVGSCTEKFYLPNELTFILYRSDAQLVPYLRSAQQFGSNSSARVDGAKRKYSVPPWPWIRNE
jgi:hypothetical protein